MTTDRRVLIADAAIGTLADEGMRGFTHRAVDRAAGLAEGSTSYYFRTRESLLFAALARIAELDTADIGDLPDPGGAPDLDELAALVTALVRHWLTEGRVRTLARYELTLESTRRPELHAKLIEYRSGFLAMTENMLAAAGAPEPKRHGRALIAYLDGLVYHQVTGVGGGELDDLHAACRDMLAVALKN